MFKIFKKIFKSKYKTLGLAILHQAIIKIITIKILNNFIWILIDQIIIIIIKTWFNPKKLKILLEKISIYHNKNLLNLKIIQIENIQIKFNKKQIYKIKIVY